MGPLFSAVLLFLGAVACLTVAFAVFRFFVNITRAIIAACFFVIAGAFGSILTAATLSFFMPETFTSSSEVVLFLVGIATGGIGLGGGISWTYVKVARFNSTIDLGEMRGPSQR